MSPDTEKTIKKMPAGAIKLQFAGDLILAKSPGLELGGFFRRYRAIFEEFANYEREDRIVKYKMLCALMLTSHAKKAQDPEVKKALFDEKNAIFADITNTPETRCKVMFRYLVSKNFRVTKFCDACTKKNTEEETPKHKWSFCKDCVIDRNFFNVVSMHHKFDKGFITLFLSNDRIEELKWKNFKHRGKLDDVAESARLGNFQYTVKNLDAFELESVKKMHEKLKSQ